MEFIVLGGLLALGVFLFLGRRGRRGKASGRVRCADCRHRGKLLDDGVICQFNQAGLYKTPVQIRLCMNYEKES